MDIVGVDALLHAPRPPACALTGGLYVHQVQAVGVAEVVAVRLGLHQHPLVDVQARVVDHVVAEDHLRLVDSRLHGGRLAVEVGVAVGIVLDDDLGPHADAQAIEGVVADLAVLVGAGNHLVGLVIAIGGSARRPPPHSWFTARGWPYG